MSLDRGRLALEPIPGSPMRMLSSICDVLMSSPQPPYGSCSMTDHSTLETDEQHAFESKQHCQTGAVSISLGGLVSDCACDAAQVCHLHQHAEADAGPALRSCRDVRLLRARAGDERAAAADGSLPAVPHAD